MFEINGYKHYSGIIWQGKDNKDKIEEKRKTQINANEEMTLSRRGSQESTTTTQTTTTTTETNNSSSSSSEESSSSDDSSDSDSSSDSDTESVDSDAEKKKKDSANVDNGKLYTITFLLLPSIIATIIFY